MLHKYPYFYIFDIRTSRQNDIRSFFLNLRSQKNAKVMFLHAISIDYTVLSISWKKKFVCY